MMKVKLFMVLLILSFVSISRSQTTYAQKANNFGITSLENISLKLIVSDNDNFDFQKNVVFKNKTISARIFLANNGSSLFMTRIRGEFLQYTPVLLKDCKEIEYLPEIKEKIEEKNKEEKESFRFSGPSYKISPSQEEKLYTLKLVDWYGKLEQGVYQISVKLNFGEGIFIESNKVIFAIEK